MVRSYWHIVVCLYEYWCYVIRQIVEITQYCFGSRTWIYLSSTAKFIQINVPCMLQAKFLRVRDGQTKAKNFENFVLTRVVAAKTVSIYCVTLKVFFSNFGWDVIQERTLIFFCILLNADANYMTTNGYAIFQHQLIPKIPTSTCFDNQK